MSTSLNEIQNKLPVKVNSDDKDSKLVNEILNEMNQNENDSKLTESNVIQRDEQSPANNIEINNQNTNFLDHQMDPNINMNNLDLTYGNDEQMQINPECMPTPVPVKQTLLSKLKEPVLILIISFIIFSPLITTNMYNLMPKILTNSINGINIGIKYVGVFIRSLVVALVMFLLKTFVL